MTEGGGIRAAFWTAQVLTGIEDAGIPLSRHVYAISSVSGGSLGAATYLSALAQRGRGATLADLAAKTLTHDFLAPPLAKGLYGDFVQQIIPTPIRALDRATALEDAWLQGESGEIHLFGRPISGRNGVWSHGGVTLPRLFLNATVVETGQGRRRS